VIRVGDLIPNPQSLIPSFSSVANALVTALLAPSCAVCSAILDEPLCGCVCGNCWAAIRPIKPPICDGCGDPVTEAQARCAECRTAERAVDRSRAIGEYDGALREIIHALKYAGRRSLSVGIADQMRVGGADLLKDADCIVPVPLHWRREYRRGFNQARELARYLGPPVIFDERATLVRRLNSRHIGVAKTWSQHSGFAPTCSEPPGLSRA
jgi:predicted amidophosphoribosyltransferase